MRNSKVTSMLVCADVSGWSQEYRRRPLHPSKKYITKELNNVSNFSSIRVLGSPDVEYRQSNGSKTTVFYIRFGIIW